jgi:hypothetical protein
MKKLLLTCLLIINILLSINVPIQQIKAPPPPRPPYQFIGEITPNCSSRFNLSNTSILIMLDLIKPLNSIYITFDANYTLYNPEQTSNITLFLPISLNMEINESNFDILLNGFPNSFILSQYNFENKIYDLDLSIRFYINSPVYLIRTNFTALENSINIIEYKFEGNIPYILSSSSFELAYYINSSRTWQGYSSGRVVFEVYNMDPVFGTLGNYNIPRLVETDGYKKCTYEWNGLKIQDTAFIMEQFKDYGYIIPIEFYYSIFVSIGVWIIIITGIIIWVQEKKRKSRNSRSISN